MNNPILNPGEQILWQGKPEFLPYFLNSFLVWLIIIIVVVVGLGILTAYMVPTLKIGLWFFEIIVGLVVIIVLSSNMMHKVNTTYYVTDQRILNTESLVSLGQVQKPIEYAEITDVKIVKNFGDKLSGKDAGTILISTPNSWINMGMKYGGVKQTPYKLVDVKNPQAALDIITAHTKK